MVRCPGGSELFSFRRRWSSTVRLLALPTVGYFLVLMTAVLSQHRFCVGSLPWGERALQLSPAAGAAQFRGLTLPTVGCFMRRPPPCAEVATLCWVVFYDLHLPERYSCWRGRNSRDRAVPGSPVAGSTCWGLRPLGSEAVALCGTVFVLCSSCASETSSALAGDSGKGVFAGQSDCRQHLFGG